MTYTYKFEISLFDCYNDIWESIDVTNGILSLSKISYPINRNIEMDTMNPMDCFLTFIKICSYLQNDIFVGYSKIRLSTIRIKITKNNKKIEESKNNIVEYNNGDIFYEVQCKKCLEYIKIPEKSLIFADWNKNWQEYHCVGINKAQFHLCICQKCEFICNFCIYLNTKEEDFELTSDETSTESSNSTEKIENQIKTYKLENKEESNDII